MPRRFQRLQAHATEFQSVAIAKRCKRVFRFGSGAEIDFRADAIAQLQMPGDEIGVKMRQKYVLDLQPMFGGERDVLIRIPLRVDDGGSAGFLVSDEVRGVGQARKIELLGRSR